MNEVTSSEEVESRPRRNASKSSFKMMRPSKRVQSGDTNGTQKHWSKLEKAMLLLAVKKYGPKDYKILSETVNTKSERQIENFLAGWRRQQSDKRLLKSSPEVDTAALEAWLRAAEDFTPPTDLHHPDVNQLLSVTFETISLFEDHPKPAECGGIDFRKAYHALSLLMCGLPLQTLTPATANFVLETFTQIHAEYNERNHIDLVHFLQTHENIPKHVTPSSKGKPQVTEVAGSANKETALESLMKLPSFNPLGIPSNLIKRPGASNN